MAISLFTACNCTRARWSRPKGQAHTERRRRLTLSLLTTRAVRGSKVRPFRFFMAIMIVVDVPSSSSSFPSNYWPVYSLHTHIYNIDINIARRWPFVHIYTHPSIPFRSINQWEREKIINFFSFIWWTDRRGQERTGLNDELIYRLRLTIEATEWKRNGNFPHSSNPINHIDQYN